MPSISSPVGTALGHFTSAAWTKISNALGRLQKQSRATRILLLLTLFALTAYLDLVIDHDLSLFALYLIPTLYSASYLGNVWAYSSCFASSGVWIVDDWHWWHSYQYAFVPYGNLAGRLVVLLIIVVIVSALKNAREDQYDAERKVLARELEIASEVQRRLLPSEAPSYPGLELGFIYRPARDLGGDYYDFIPVTSQRLAFGVADVSGKGLPSALLMASLQGIVRTNLAIRESKLAYFAKEVSERIYDETTDDRFATLFFASIDTSTFALDYVNAGHNPPLLVRKWTAGSHDVKPQLLNQGGPPLGVFADTQYRCGRTLLQEGDVLVLYTDGIVEAANAQQEQFGEERFVNLVRSSVSLSANEICREVLEHLDAFTGANPQWDDITLVIVKVKHRDVDSSARQPRMHEVSELAMQAGD